MLKWTALSSESMWPWETWGIDWGVVGGISGVGMGDEAAVSNVSRGGSCPPFVLPPV